jgi:hypothetical protein
MGHNGDFKYVYILVGYYLHLLYIQHRSAIPQYLFALLYNLGRYDLEHITNMYL